MVAATVNRTPPRSLSGMKGDMRMKTELRRARSAIAEIFERFAMPAIVNLSKRSKIPSLALRARLSVTLAVALLAPAFAHAAEIDPEWREPVSRLAAFVADLSAGEMEAAWQKYRIMLPEPPHAPKSPFEPDPFDGFQKGIGQFPRDVESLSLIAERAYSTKSRRLYFIADTKMGPVLIETVVYRHKDEWFFAHFGYQAVAFADANWHRLYEEILPVAKHAEPIPVPLPQASATAETSAP